MLKSSNLGMRWASSPKVKAFLVVTAKAYELKSSLGSLAEEF